VDFFFPVTRQCVTVVSLKTCLVCFPVNMFVVFPLHASVITEFSSVVCTMYTIRVTQWDLLWKVTYRERGKVDLFPSLSATEKNARPYTLLKKNLPTSHGGDHTWKFWIFRSNSFPVRSFECWGLRLLTWNFVWKFEDSPENVFGMYGDSRENSFEIVAVVIILSPISSVCDAYTYIWEYI